MSHVKGIPHKMHKNSLANLSMFKPGNNANPNGRPKNSLTPVEALKSLMGLQDPDLVRNIAKQGKRSRGRPVKVADKYHHVSYIMAARQLVTAMDSPYDETARKSYADVANRIDGMPVQVQKIETTDRDRFKRTLVVLPATDPKRLEYLRSGGGLEDDQEEVGDSE